MDSKTVNSQIGQRIWPLLRAAGFGEFTSRTAWRHSAGRIDVINFQSFNAHLAESLGCTSYSFAVNLGCHLDAIPSAFEPVRIKQKAGRLLPLEYECHFRGELSRGFAQAELERRSIWYLDPAGQYLDRAIDDVEQRVSATALWWFQRLSDPAEILTILLCEDEAMGERWGFGRNPSPVRHYYTGYIARQCGRQDLALEHLRLALDSGCFEAVRERIEADMSATDDRSH